MSSLQSTPVFSDKVKYKYDVEIVLLKAIVLGEYKPGLQVLCHSLIRVSV